MLEKQLSVGSLVAVLSCGSCAALSFREFLLLSAFTQGKVASMEISFEIFLCKVNYQSSNLFSCVFNLPPVNVIVRVSDAVHETLYKIIMIIFLFSLFLLSIRECWCICIQYVLVSNSENSFVGLQNQHLEITENYRVIYLIFQDVL